MGGGAGSPILGDRPSNKPGRGPEEGKCTAGRGGGSFKLGGNANTERSPGTSTFPIPFHSFRQPPTHPLKTPILQVVRPRSRAGTKLLSAPSPDLIESLGMRGGGEDLTRTY